MPPVMKHLMSWLPRGHIKHRHFHYSFSFHGQNFASVNDSLENSCYHPRSSRSYRLKVEFVLDLEGSQTSYFNTEIANEKVPVDLNYTITK